MSATDTDSGCPSDAGKDEGGGERDTGAERDLTTGPVWRELAVIAGPMVFGLAAVLSVGLVDTFFVSKLGTQQLAALSFAFPVTVVMTGLCIGLGAGAASVVSREIGAGDEDCARRMALHSMLLGILTLVAVSIAGWFATPLIFTALGAEGPVHEDIVTYMRIWWWSMPFLVMSIVAHNIVRSVGNATWPSVIMTISATVNIAATAALVFGFAMIPEMGIAGAATGTLVARASVVWISIWLITSHVNMVTWRIPELSVLKSAWWDVGKVAGPAALGNMVNPFSIALVTAILAGFSEAVVAAFGVATRVESIATIPLLAMSAAMAPISGQNWGADKVGRIRSTLKLSFLCSLVWAGVLAGVFWMFAEPIAGVFSSEDGVAEDAAKYLRIVPISLFGFGVVVCSASAFNAIDQATRGLAYYAGRSALLYLPLSWIGSLIAKEEGVYYGIAAANVVAGLLVGAYALHWLRKQERGEDTEAEEDEFEELGLAPAE